MIHVVRAQTGSYIIIFEKEEIGMGYVLVAVVVAGVVIYFTTVKAY